MSRQEKLQARMSFFTRKKNYTDEEQQKLSSEEKQEYLADTSVPLKKRVSCCLLPASSCASSCTCSSWCQEVDLLDGEHHKSTSGTAGWLRAAVLGANDSLVSVSAIMV